MKNIIIFIAVTLFYVGVQASTNYFTVTDLASVTHGGEIAIASK